jgi:hypothetical protein
LKETKHKIRRTAHKSPEQQNRNESGDDSDRDGDLQVLHKPRLMDVLRMQFKRESGALPTLAVLKSPFDWQLPDAQTPP